MSRRSRLLAFNLGAGLFVAGYLLGITASAAGAGSQKSDAPAPVLPPADSRIQFPEPEADLGKLEAGRQVVHSFRFSNEGRETLILGRISSSCRCAVARPDSSVLTPGQASALTVRLETTGMAGWFRREIWVETNDRNQPLVRLALYGEVAVPRR